MSATSFAVASVAKPIKCAILVKLSTTTIIWVQPWDSGSWVMKSVEIQVHAAYGTSSG